MAERIVRIGGASGAWGDSPMALVQLLGEPVDYLVMDYLAEVTMSLLARSRQKKPEFGFVPDFVAYLVPHLATIAERGIGVVTNAGGINPRACKHAIEAAAAEKGVQITVAVVEGDDLMPGIDGLRASTRELTTGAPLPDRLLSANAYLGAAPIAAALAEGAKIVITGRCVDSALALGILQHEFGWHGDQFDLLAAGSLVGHLLECGPQVTGGLFTDWESVPGWHDIGYPIAECASDGTFVVTKPAGTGGLVVPASVAEQVLYEIGDPAAYLLPDVTADFSRVHLEQAGGDRVRVSGARGLPPPTSYKVSATYEDGYRATALVVIIGVDAVAKAERTAEALIARARMLFAREGFGDFTAVHVEVLGAEASYRSASRARASREVVLRLVADHRDARALDVLARQVGAVGLSFAQGTAGLIGGRPKPTPLVRLYSFLIDKAALAPAQVTVADRPAFAVPLVACEGGLHAAAAVSTEAVPLPAEEELVEVTLMQVAHARSGDKGNSSNIAIFCRRPEYFAYLRAALTPERLAAHFAGTAGGPVRRYEAPGLAAFNFVLDDALGGGGVASPRIDPQGKAYGQRALELRLPVPAAWMR